MSIKKSAFRGIEISNEDDECVADDSSSFWGRVTIPASSSNFELGDDTTFSDGAIEKLKKALGYSDVIVKCLYCGQWGASKTMCQHCGQSVG